MASIGSISTSTSSSIRGYGGLASGLDRDELIKGMTMGTTTKITQQEQKKQKTEWMQEAVRAISDKMISFHGKYTETLTSSSNLFSAVLWGRNKITTNGDNSKYVTVSGSAKAAEAMTIMGVKQRAENVSWSSVESVSTGAFSGDAFKDDYLDKIAGQTLKFSYNGTEAEIKLPTSEDLAKLKESISLTAEELAEAGDDPEAVEAIKNAKAKEVIGNEIKKSIQDQLDVAFGKDRIKVEGTSTDGLTFTTMVPGTSTPDKSSVFKITGGAEAADALGLSVGKSTRLNDFSEKIGTAGKVKINGVEISFTENESIADLMTKISEKTGLKISYMEASDKFTFSSNEKGASGAISFDDNAAYTAGNNKLNDIFKLGIGTTTADNATGYEKRGKDAIVAVKYAGSDDVVELRRDSNTFTVDGLTLSLKGTFGWDKVKDENGNVIQEDGKDKFDWVAKTDSTQAIEVNAEVDVDKLMSTIKSFVDEYNEIVDLVNSELTTKHERDYDPLTSDQKSELSESEIEKWEKKAKEGLLYGDSDLRSLSMDLRVVVSGGLLVKFEEIGISLSSSYSDNGKLSIDESKLRAALETNPEKVQDLFTSEEGVDEKGDPTFNGLARNLKNVMDKYVKTMGSMETKGILIRKAGSKSSPQSLTQNTYYDQITSIEKLLDQLKARLKKEQDRYISQFSSLETLIANMNSQSSYLSSMSGY